MDPSVLAAESGEPVEVSSERTTSSQTFANPDGTFTLRQWSGPRWAKDAAGSWQDIDVTLERRADGTVGPRAAAIDLGFSAGGSGERLIQVADEEGRSLSLGWSGDLPAPVLDGASATYVDVLPDVDLRLTATADGYREVLVVKSAEAAQNPELATVSLGVTQDGLRVVPGAGGGVRAVDENGNAVLVGPAGQMWDSAGGTGGAAAARTSGTAAEGDEVDPADGPSDGDAVATLPVTVSEDAISVVPDPGLLTGPETVYPVYIDPSLGLGRSEWTKISSDGDRFWKFDGDLGVGKCGNADGYTCGPGYVDRMYFEFAPTKLRGKYVLDATFRARETWSFNCDAHTLNLKRTDNISEATRWPGPTQRDLLGDRQVSAGRGDLCSPEQPDAWIEFNDNPAETDENLTPTVRQFAAGAFSRLTLMLQANDETEPRAWKRIADNAELEVVYVQRPGVPTNVGVIPGNGTTAYCRTSSDPLIVTRTDPMVRARVQTLVQPATGEHTGLLRAEYVVEKRTASGWQAEWGDYRPSTGWDPDGTLEGMRTPTLTDGVTYRLKARTRSHWTYNTVPDDLWSGYSSWCYFTLDSTAPQPPVITSVGPYVECTADGCVGMGGPGVPGTFRFAPNPADTDITGYRWRLLSTSTYAETTGPEVTVTPRLGGLQILTVEARDVRSRWGPPQEFYFHVAPPPGPVGRWHFDDGTPGSAVTTAADSTTETVRHDATLYAPGSDWSEMARRGGQDHSLWLNDAADTSGYAATAAPAVNTQGSFTVAAWAYLTDTSTNHVVLSAPGTHASAFALYYSASARKWMFNRTDQDSDQPAYIRSISDVESPAPRVWTHLAGVFDTKGDTDRMNDTIQLFVNGRPQGEPVVAAHAAPTFQPWASSEGLQFGRFKSAGTYSEYFRGRVDEVQVWQQPLTEELIREDTRLLDANGLPAAELVASWDATSALGAQIAQSSPYPAGPMALSATGASLENDNALLLDGVSGYASTTGPVIDETGSFTVSVRFLLDSTKLADKPVGYVAQIVGQRAGDDASWALQFEKTYAEGGLWRFVRNQTDASGAVVSTAVASSDELAELDTVVQLTGVFDGSEIWQDENGIQRHGKVLLYTASAGQLDKGTEGFAAAQQGVGELAIGRGFSAGAPARYAPAVVEDFRVWAGAMTGVQVRAMAMGEG